MLRVLGSNQANLRAVQYMLVKIHSEEATTQAEAQIRDPLRPPPPMRVEPVTAPNPRRDLIQYSIICREDK